MKKSWRSKYSHLYSSEFKTEVEEIANAIKLQKLVKEKCDLLERFTDFPNQVSRAIMLELIEQSEK